MSPKVAVIYYSATGHNYRLAKAVVQGAEGAGAEVRLRKVQELAPKEAIESNLEWKKHVDETSDVQQATHDDLLWADGYVFGSPTRFGNIAAQLKQFLDSTGPIWAEGKMANKVASGFTSAQNPHGGQEATLLSLYHTMHHWGCIVVPPGYTDPLLFAAGGNPYGVSATADGPADEMPDAVLTAASYLGKRVTTVAGWIVKGQSA